LFSRIELRIVACAVALRVVSAILGLVAILTIPLASPAPTTMFAEPSPLWDQFTRYDAGWYSQIARYGYWFVPGGPSAGVGKPGKIAYFPLYPLAARLASVPFGRSPAAFYLGGIVVSWIAFAAAMVALFHLARLDLDEERSERAVVLAAIFPFAFFFGMVYTESLFLLLTLVTFYAFRTRHWLAGGLAGALATATRVNGMLMLPALAWIAWRGAAPGSRDRLRAGLGLVLVGGGVAAYSAYVYRLSGNPFEWATSISRWNYHPGGAPWLAPLQLISRLATHPYRYLTTDPMAVYDTFYGVTGILFIVAIPFVWHRLGAAYALFMALNLWLPLSSGVFEGMGRYCSVLFPFFIWLGSIRSRTISMAIVVTFALLYAIAQALFVTLRPLF
jgi:Mannosyltransferase (PIG-V)